MRTILPIFFSMFIHTAPVALAQQRILTPELLWAVGRVTLDAVAPDGSAALYGVQRFDVAKNSSTRTLYIVDLKTLESRPVTDPSGTATDGAFHPSGRRIGFIRNGKLCETDWSGAAVQELTDFEINGFHYAPNGEYVLFTRNVKYDQTPAEKYPDLPNVSGRISNSLFYRHWKSWHDYRYSNVFYAAYSGGKITGAPINIMNEPFDSPLRPLGGMEQIAWSPDCRSIVYTCRKLNGTAETQSTDSDLYQYDLATGKTTNLTSGMPGYDLDPVFSPDGRYLAWTSMERPGNEADRTRLMILDFRTGQRRELPEQWIFEANHPQWAPDSKSLYFLSSTDFTYQIFQIGLDDRKIKRLTTGQHDYTAFQVAGERLVATRVSTTTPAEVFLIDPRSGNARALSEATKDPWATIAPAKVERRTVKTTDGKDMNVWLVLPPGFDPQKKYPALLYCQGGPQSALSSFFSYRWNLQLMASKGYVIIAPCRRGMPGGPYGQAWNDPISGDWGGQAMQDLLSATDAMAKEPFIDPARIGAVGASFGGYSVYWLAGNHNKRFKTFIAHCGMFNTTSWYGTTEELWFATQDLGGDAYWNKPNDPSWTTFSPHLFIKNWDTPILVMHNELDFRVPFSEGMQAFQAAQLRGLRSRMVSFPDEGHWMTKAQNSLMWQREFFEWLAETL